MTMSYYLCLSCGNVYNGRFLRNEDIEVPCPMCSCHYYAFEIDEEMIIPIRMLNEKGYITQHCCSGHIFDDSCGGYISFVYPEEIKDALEGWYIDKKGVLRYHMDTDETEANKLKTIHSHIESLIQWCENLEILD